VKLSPPPQPAEQFPPPARKVMGASVLSSGKKEIELDLWILSDELKVTTVFTAMADWWAMHPLQDTSARLITASADEELQSHDWEPCLLDQNGDRRPRTAIEWERANVTKDTKNIGLAAG
jgi:hypothetical protein